MRLIMLHSCLIMTVSFSMTVCAVSSRALGTVSRSLLYIIGLLRLQLCRPYTWLKWLHSCSSRNDSDIFVGSPGSVNYVTKFFANFSVTDYDMPSIWNMHKEWAACCLSGYLYNLMTGSEALQVDTDSFL